MHCAQVDQSVLKIVPIEQLSSPRRNLLMRDRIHQVSSSQKYKLLRASYLVKQSPQPKPKPKAKPKPKSSSKRKRDNTPTVRRSPRVQKMQQYSPVQFTLQERDDLFDDVFNDDGYVGDEEHESDIDPKSLQLQEAMLEIERLKTKVSDLDKILEKRPRHPNNPNNPNNPPTSPKKDKPVALPAGGVDAVALPAGGVDADKLINLTAPAGTHPHIAAAPLKSSAKLAMEVLVAHANSQMQEVRMENLRYQLETERSRNAALANKTKINGLLHDVFGNN